MRHTTLALCLLGTVTLFAHTASAKEKKLTQVETELKNKTGDVAGGIRILISRPGLLAGQVTVNKTGWDATSGATQVSPNQVLITYKKAAGIAADAKATTKFEVPGTGKITNASTIWIDSSFDPVGKPVPVPSADIVADPQYFEFYDFGASPDAFPDPPELDVSNEQIEWDVPGIPLDSLDYDSSDEGSYGLPHAPYDLSLDDDSMSGNPSEFDFPTDIPADDFTYARGFLLDPDTGENVGDFVQGFQWDILPEPATLGLIFAAAPMLLRRKAH